MLSVVLGFAINLSILHSPKEDSWKLPNSLPIQPESSGIQTKAPTAFVWHVLDSVSLDLALRACQRVLLLVW